MMDSEGIVVGGIRFFDEAQAKRAATEAKRIEALNANMQYDNTKAVYNLYSKAQANDVFQTPVGITYMLQLQQHLLEAGVDPSLVLPLNAPKPEAAKPEKEKPEQGRQAQGGTAASEGEASEGDEEAGEEATPTSHAHVTILEARVESQKSHMEKMSGTIRMQWYCIVALIVIVIAMFVISQTGNNPTILNYRTKIINQYSEWEKELSEREAALSLKESGL